MGVECEFYAEPGQLGWGWARGQSVAKIMTEIVATNVIASQPPKCRPNEMPNARAKIIVCIHHHHLTSNSMSTTSQLSVIRFSSNFKCFCKICLETGNLTFLRLFGITFPLSQHLHIFQPLGVTEHELLLSKLFLAPSKFHNAPTKQTPTAIYPMLLQATTSHRKSATRLLMVNSKLHLCFPGEVGLGGW